MRIGTREFDTRTQTYLMGILNVTPDSFSDGGKYNQMDQAMFRVEQMVKEGADIIDVGGESTRPGYSMVEEAEEIERIAPVIEKIKSNFNIPISLDTYKSKVAEAGILAGADLINDIWGLKYDIEMAAVLAKSQIACCLMHNRKEQIYEDFLKDVLKDLAETVDLAVKAGISYEKMILDPGIGFAKNYQQNLLMLNRLEELHTFGLPILLGASRKSVIGQTLDLEVEQRLEGTLVTTVLAVMKKCSFVRVHDIAANKRGILMAQAIRDAV